MGLSINKIVSILSERSGRTFDIPFQRQLSDQVDYWRSTILKRSLEKGALRRRHFLHSFTIELEQVPEIECPIQFGCVLRSKSKIPKPIYSNNILFDFVGSADFYKPFKYADKHQIDKLIHSEYKSLGMYYTYTNGYLEFYGNSELKYVGIKSVIDNPKDLYEVQCNNSSCYNDDSDYPLSLDLIQAVIEALLKTDLNIVKTEEEVPEVEVVQEPRTR